MTVRFPLRRASHLIGAISVLVLGMSTQATAATGLPGPAGAASVSGSEVARPGPPPPAGAGPLAVAFAAAATRYDVPRDLLVALGFAETRLDGHGGAPSFSGGYGVMHLVSNPSIHTLDEAARLTGVAGTTLRTDAAANISGAAAVLRGYADAAGMSARDRSDVGAWYPLVVRYGGATDQRVARLYGDTVYDLLATGLTAGGPGNRVTVTSRTVTPRRGALAAVPALGTATATRSAGTGRSGTRTADSGAPSTADSGAPSTADSGALSTESTDYGPAAWAPAASTNFTVSSRPTAYPINYVVIHVTQETYADAIAWFQNPVSKVSAHYVFRSSDGAVTQTVREKDIAWHAGNWTYNTQSIGIEHEGWVDDSTWFTDSMYRASAALTRSLCAKYGIPRDRTHIIGHVEVPGATHTDPGPLWDWTYYMQLVNGVTGIGSGTVGVSGSLNVRAGPGTGYAVVGTVANGTVVSIYCQAPGTTVTGTYGTSSVWDRIGTDRWVSDAYVHTGYASYIPGVPRC